MYQVFQSTYLDIYRFAIRHLIVRNVLSDVVTCNVYCVDYFGRTFGTMVGLPTIRSAYLPDSTTS